MPILVCSHVDVFFGSVDLCHFTVIIMASFLIILLQSAYGPLYKLSCLETPLLFLYGLCIYIKSPHLNHLHILPHFINGVVISNPTLIHQASAGHQRSHVWATLNWLKLIHNSIQMKKRTTDPSVKLMHNHYDADYSNFFQRAKYDSTRGNILKLKTIRFHLSLR